MRVIADLRHATVSLVSTTMIEPELCQSMDQVRSAIDELDGVIIDVLARRFRYVEAAARIKDSRETVRDDTRKAQIVARAELLARERGLPANLIGRLYEQLIEGAIAFELAKFDQRG